MADITLTKDSLLIDGNGNGLANAGEVIRYTFTIENNSGSPLSGITLSDSKLFSSPIAVPGTLAPNASTIFIQDYLVTQADIDAGKVDTTTIATGISNANPVTSDAIDDSELPGQNSVINITKTLQGNQSYQDLNLNLRPDVGETTTYNYTVINGGNTSLFNVTLEDFGLPTNPSDTVPVPLTGLTDLDGDGASDDLAPGATATGTYVYSLTQETLDIGTFSGTAGAIGEVPPDGDKLPATGSVQVRLLQQPRFEIVKTAGTLKDGPDLGEFTDLDGNGIDPGDAINYSYTFTNTGNVTLKDVKLVDDHGTPGDLTDDPTIVLNKTILAPGESATGIYKGTLTQAIINAGSLKNIVTGTAKDPKNVALTPKKDDETVNIAPKAEFVIAKTAGTTKDAADGGEFTDLDNNGIDAGDAVNYSYTFTNTGNVTLNDVKLVDDNGTPGVPGDDKTIVLDKATLLPGEVATGTYVGTLTQEAINAGLLKNIVTGTAKDPKNVALPEKKDDETVNIAPKAEFVIAKTAGTTKDAADGGEFTDLDNNGIDAGDAVNYSYTFTNTGNVTLNDVKLVDDNGTPSIPGDDKTIVLDKATLLPGEVATGTYIGTLTQEAINAGLLKNIVTGTAKDPAGTPLTPKQDDETVNIAPKSDFTIAKTAGTVKDAADLGEFTDLDNNGIDAGDAVNYSYTFTNTGNVTLNDVKLVDDNGTPGVPGDDKDILLDKTTLLPGEVATGTYVGTLTQAAINAGSLKNIVTGTAKDPTGTPLTPKQDDEIVSVTPKADFAIAKTAGTVKDAADAGEFTDLDGNGIDAGDAVNYSYTFTNTGNVTLTDVKLVDDNGTPGVPGDDKTIVLDKTTLLPGEVATGTYVGTLTQEAINAGLLKNIVTGTAKDPTGTPLTPKQDDETVSVAPQPGLSLIKTAGNTRDLADSGEFVNTNNNALIGDAGDQVNYKYEVKNTGNVTLYNLNLKDDNGTADASDDIPIILKDASGATLTSLAVGQSATGSYLGTITAAAVSAKILTNIATVEATTGPDPTSPKLPPVTDTETVIPVAPVVVPPEPPKISLVKTAALIADVNHDCVIGEGDQVTYRYEVKNTGPVNLLNLVLTDDNGTPETGDDFVIPLTSGLSNLDGGTQANDLAVGGVAIATYVKTLSSADVHAGSFTNLAIVTAVGPQGQPVKAQDPETINLKQFASGVQLEKEGCLDLGEDCVAGVGDVITYAFKVTNTGALAIDTLTLDDSLPNLSAIQWNGSTTLNPGQSVEGKATYALTADDLAWGRVVNFAAVYANPAGGVAGDRADDALDLDESWIELTPGPNTPSTAGNLVGDGTTETINGTAAADIIAGGLGDDRIFGAGGNDILRGDVNSSAPGDSAGGDDLIDGGAGDDRIGGKGGDDTLLGGAGNDLLWGDAGDDALRGGAGNDRLRGDNEGGVTGEDTFILAAGEGLDWILDFQVGSDRVGLAGGLSFGALTLRQSGGDTLIQIGQARLALLEGVAATALTASDFVLV